MDVTRRQLLAGAGGTVAAAWGVGSYLRRDAVAVVDQYALLNEDAREPFVDLSCLVGNDATTRVAAEARLTLALPDGTTRTATETVEPFGGDTDEALATFRFPDRSVDELARGTARFAVTDCRRLGLVPPLLVGCDESVVTEDVER